MFEGTSKANAYGGFASGRNNTHQQQPTVPPLLDIVSRVIAGRLAGGRALLLLVIAVSSMWWMPAKAGSYGCPLNGGCDEGEALVACRVHVQYYRQLWPNGSVMHCAKRSATEYAMRYDNGNWIGYVGDVDSYIFRLPTETVPNRITRGKNAGPPKCTESCFGDPINAANGNKFEVHQEFLGSGRFPLQLAWTYNSLSAPNFASASSMLFGKKRAHTYSSNLVYLPETSTPSAYVTRPDGKVVRFQFQSGAWIADADADARLTGIPQSGATGWTYESISGSTDEFDAAGRLVVRSDRDKSRQVLTYDTVNRISKVTDESGRSISFVYGTTPYAQQAVLPDGSAINFEFTTDGYLKKAIYADSTVVEYRYDEATFVPSTSLKGFLTGVIDESAQRYSSTKYDAWGLGIGTYLGSNQNAESATYTFPPGGSLPTQVVVQEAAGAVRKMTFVTDNGIVLPATSTTTCSGCATRSTSLSYSTGRVTSVTQNGTLAQSARDSLGRVTARIEAASSSDGNKRTIETDWFSSFALPLERRVKDSAGVVKKRQAWTYNPRGQALTSSRQDPVAGTSRTYSYVYCELADVAAASCSLEGLLLSVDGPLSGTVDLTSYQYYAEDAPTCISTPTTCPYRKGDLWKVTNALGQVTEILKYDGAGRMLSSKDVNGVVTDRQYHPRGWLTSVKMRGVDDSVETDDAITRIEYWPTGLVKRVTQPDGAYTQYTYDQAHRLTDVTDNAGNLIHYTLDLAGNRIKEETKNSSGVLKRTMSRVFNQLSQLTTQADAQANPTDFTYDANGNGNTVTDALSCISDSDYDPLNRLSRTLQDVGGIEAETKFAYDPMDNLTKVTDPKGLDTTYTYNGLGDLTQLSSPDTGVTTYTYDAAGNRATQTDARGITSTYSYDALGRISGIAYPTSSLNVAYVYDTTQAACIAGETYSIGRMTRMDDASGNTQYCYNRFGQLVRKVQTTNGIAFTVRYSWDKAGRLTGMVYPDGSEVDYTRNALGQITAMGITRPGQAREVLLNQVTYLPFGPTTGWTYGNGRVMTRSYDQDYRPTAILDASPGGLSLGFGYDAVGNLTKLGTATGVATPDVVYGYDALGRLTRTADGPSNVAIDIYSYDKTGNRLTHVTSAGTLAYSYPANSHRLTAVSGISRTFDAIGNTVTSDGREYDYIDSNRIGQVKSGGAVMMSYVYNGLGLLVRRSAGTSDMYAFYDESGRWLGDYDGSGEPINEVVWMEDLPVGLIKGTGELHYLQPDHLGAPRMVIEVRRNSSVWAWNLLGEAFGNSSPNEDVDGDSVPMQFNMRFAGQLFDLQLNAARHQFRDYDASVGRFMQSDPIGLAGGIQSFGYASSSPIGGFDFDGLMKVNLFGSKGDPIYNLRVQQYQDASDKCLVYGHGGPSVIYDSSSGETKNIYYAEDLAKLLLDSGCTKDMDVILYACNTGKGPNSIGEDLASLNIFKSVSAPDTTIFYNEDLHGNGPSWIFDKLPAPNNHLPDRTKPGRMREF